MLKLLLGRQSARQAIAADGQVEPAPDQPSARIRNPA